ncbi:MAG: hypothetical protein QNK83_08460 [Akkermansiaceae bacterium]|nr:hypothetical protein [Akkermansiaceae bacterium]MDB4276676.1 hypothetical protein [bacterium]MDB0067899.1 hypothetical protein [Akkermansiaceae bacterium]MDB4309924.1 hypothetical protein [Akkermansiaceae bacterium]MDB4323157.1 hypothetical protein [Akkermansiaceae bacterium]
MPSILILAFTILFLTGLGYIERRRHEANLKKIPIGWGLGFGIF